MNDQVKGIVKKRRWLRRLMWGATLVFTALQMHSYYYLRFMALYPFGPGYEPSEPGLSRRTDIVNGLITPMTESLNVAKIHWGTLSQRPPQIEGLIVVEGKELENKILGFTEQYRTISWGYVREYKKNQIFRVVGFGTIVENYDLLYVVFEDKVCHTTVESGYVCAAIYRNLKNDYVFYNINEHKLVEFVTSQMGDKK